MWHTKQEFGFDDASIIYEHIQTSDRIFNPFKNWQDFRFIGNITFLWNDFTIWMRFNLFCQLLQNAIQWRNFEC